MAIAITPQIQSAVDAILSAKPEQRAQFTGADGVFDIQSFLDSTVGWWDENGASMADRLGEFGPEMRLLSALDYETAATPSQPTPLEQHLLQQSLPGLLANVQGDTGRAALAGTLQQNAITDYNLTRGILGEALDVGGKFDGAAYLQQNQDVATYFTQQPDGPTPGTKIINGHPMTAVEYAQVHYDMYGKGEGRQAPLTVGHTRLNAENAMADQTTSLLSGNARTAAASQLSALQQSIGEMQGSLTGELAARAAALQQQIASFNQNLDQFDATQKQALATQIAEQQQNLETSVAAQRTALTQEMESLRGAADTQSQARGVALADEIAGLTAAQAPMAAARLQSAEALTTAINLGLESTKDQLTANQAQAGYLGGSTMSDSALARAMVGARQQGAQAIGAAKEANAGDTRTIQNRGATEGRSLADELARNKFGIATNEATGNYDLSRGLATGTQGISDMGATGRAGIAVNTGASRMGIANTGATGTYNNALYGATGARSLSDALSQGTYGINTNLATQLKGAGDMGVMAKQGYFDNDFTRRLSLAGQLPGLTNSTASTVAGLAGLGTAGLNNTQNTLNWWSSNAQPQNLQGYTNQPSQMGNAIGNLGAGLTGAALQIGGANNWWQTPKTATTLSSMPSGTSGMDISTSMGAICWVARVVFGETNPKWMQFREWLLTKAPVKLREFYIANGERLAGELRELPEMREEFRVVMDRILQAA